MQNMQQQMGWNMPQMPSGGNQQQMPSSGGCASGKCNIPAGVDIDAYMEQQKQDQKYEQEQMAAKIKAQFESVMNEVTMKKHRYAMGVMTEFTSMCACLGESMTIYQTMFVANAKAANMTDIIDMEEEAKKMPYEAASLKEAKERIFGGMLESICKSLGAYMTFAEEVERQLEIINPQPIGK